VHETIIIVAVILGVAGASLGVLVLAVLIRDRRRKNRRRR
jgi:hypothetical protein